jgi:hypothetical protein
MVDAVELDKITGKHVDAILDFSACSDFRLVGLSSTQREQRIGEIIREEYPQIPWSILADCRTFKELQVCARLWRKARDATGTAYEALGGLDNYGPR